MVQCCFGGPVGAPCAVGAGRGAGGNEDYASVGRAQGGEGGADLEGRERLALMEDSFVTGVRKRQTYDVDYAEEVHVEDGAPF